MVDVFAEVNEDLKNDELNKCLKKYGPKVIIASVLIVLFTAASVVYSNYKSSVNQKQTVIINEMSSPEMSADDIIKQSVNLDASHKFLSDFIVAAAHAEAGELVEANAVYEEIISDAAVSEEYQDLAKLYISQNILNMEAGDLNKADNLIKPMLVKDNAFYYIAIEQKALIEAKLGNDEAAKNIFTEISGDESAPSEIKDRAEKLKTLY